MPTRTEAEEHLRVIRSLMEKATIYRAISAEAAAVGGVLAVIASFAFGNWCSVSFDFVPDGIDVTRFFGLWLGVLILAGLSNLFFVWRDARKRGDRFLSSGMKLACFALLPSYLVAAFLTLFLWESLFPVLVVSVWIICHGLGLLSTSHFAPRSLVRLGWAFLAAGLLSCWPIGHAGSYRWIRGQPDSSATMAEHSDGLMVGQMLMAMTFGGLHLIYAGCTWPRKSSASGSGVEP